MINPVATSFQFFPRFHFCSYSEIVRPLIVRSFQSKFDPFFVCSKFHASVPAFEVLML